ncbi:MAG: hypothetical protein WCE81_09000 [Halobacteriota archaeon]
MKQNQDMVLFGSIWFCGSTTNANTPASASAYEHPRLNQPDPSDVQVDNMVQIIAQNHDVLNGGSHEELERNVKSLIRINLSKYVSFAGNDRYIDANLREYVIKGFKDKGLLAASDREER